MALCPSICDCFGLSGHHIVSADQHPGLQIARLTDNESGMDSADEPDESWLAKHVDGQPNLWGPITDLGQGKLDVSVSGPYC